MERYLDAVFHLGWLRLYETAAQNIQFEVVWPLTQRIFKKKKKNRSLGVLNQGTKGIPSFMSICPKMKECHKTSIVEMKRRKTKNKGKKLFKNSVYLWEIYWLNNIRCCLLSFVYTYTRYWWTSFCWKCFQYGYPLMHMCHVTFQHSFSAGIVYLHITPSHFTPVHSYRPLHTFSNGSTFSSVFSVSLQWVSFTTSFLSPQFWTSWLSPPSNYPDSASLFHSKITLPLRFVMHNSKTSK